MKFFLCLLLACCVFSFNGIAQSRGCVIGGRFYDTGRVNYSFIVPRESYSNAISYEFKPPNYTCFPGEVSVVAIEVGPVNYFFTQIDCGLNATNFSSAVGGKVYTANITQCPFDDYVLLLLTAVIFAVLKLTPLINHKPTI